VLISASNPAGVTETVSRIGGVSGQERKARSSEEGKRREGMEAGGKK